MKRAIMLTLSLVLILTLLVPNSPMNVVSAAEGRVYEVGEDKEFTSLFDVPWGELNPGDTVKIYWREEPYREKICISRAGTAEAPITITGVPGPDGQLPVITGENAVVSPKYSFWNDNRCVLKIGGARYEGSMSDPASGRIPKYIIVENLDLRSARPTYGGEPGYTFINHNGQVTNYLTNASAIYIEYGENIVIRNCDMHDCGNGFFTASQTKNILVQGNRIYDNGIKGRGLEHNVYTSTENIIFEYNYFGPVREPQMGVTCGNNLKDRSAGTVIRYNYFVGGNRALDLVEAGEFVHLPQYRQTFVYGNVIIDIGQGTNRNVIHYGGDNGVIYDDDWNAIGDDTTNYRKGTLYFYNNTVIHRRPGIQQIFQIQSNDETVDARNNIFYMTGEENVLMDSGLFGVGMGKLHLKNNWISDGYSILVSGAEMSEGAEVTIENMIVGKNLKFVDEANDDFRLLPGSSVVDRGAPLHPDVIAAGHDLLFQYVKHNGAIPRMTSDKPEDKVLDIGAFELPVGKALGEYLKEINKK